MSWWFTRGGENRASGRLDAVEKAVEGLESRQKLMRGEWEEVHDRVNRVMGRLNARIRKVGASDSPESDEPEAPKGAATPRMGTGTHGRLSEMRAKYGVLPR